MISKDKVLGSFIGAAIGDAMGGPVECQHAARIKKYYGPIISLLPYQKPPGLMELHPGYALQAEPGSITDDTFIRIDFARFFLEKCSDSHSRAGRDRSKFAILSVYELIYRFVHSDSFFYFPKGKAGFQLAGLEAVPDCLRNVAAIFCDRNSALFSAASGWGIIQAPC